MFPVTIENRIKEFKPSREISSPGKMKIYNTPLLLLKLPLGVSSGFWPLIQSVFRDFLKDEAVVIYLDGIVIPAKVVDEDMLKLGKVLEIARKCVSKIRWSKRQFLEEHITFLRYEIRDRKILLAERKSQAIRDFPVPRYMKELQRFLGLTSYFRRFIIHILRKDTNFTMRGDQVKAVKELKQALVLAPVIKLSCITRLP